MKPEPDRVRIGIRRRVRVRGYPRPTIPTCRTTCRPAIGPEPAEPEFRRPAAEAPSYVARTPTPKPPPRSQHSGEWEGGEWTGSHRAIQPGRRGVSWASSAHWSRSSWWWAAFILWRFFGDALSNRSSIASARCVDGQKAVAVIADPAIADRDPDAGQEIQRNGRTRSATAASRRRQTGRIRPGDQRLRRYLARATR